MSSQSTDSKGSNSIRRPLNFSCSVRPTRHCIDKTRLQATRPYRVCGSFAHNSLRENGVVRLRRLWRPRASRYLYGTSA